MIVFRLSKSIYANDLTGKGAEKTGGRWNSKGTALLYTSSSRALCTAEIAVHVPLGILPNNYKIIAFEIPDKLKIKHLSTNELPNEWASIPPGFSTQEIGNKFVKINKFAVLEVPSVVVPGDLNYLLNPFHLDFKMIKLKSIENFGFDKRLFIK